MPNQYTNKPPVIPTNTKYVIRLMIDRYNEVSKQWETPTISRSKKEYKELNLCMNDITDLLGNLTDMKITARVSIEVIV